ncbi:hypothetical protein LY28_00826 [Ruminiclostridium sufflavum DSM 19573]|uniref:Heat induced stress protein YflT n=1 Tax=Ruminiclostridium sufflavum DSM 19573 TaxID=1121337 RepID=A0A318XN32_9FIRM|nr:hypothetical protein [Ruminiclostridium sufflavum]PYG89006.1 hypothetical protein LY28_00826 [Ruminiclostridium sufflavum DSM 19573]
MARTIVAIFEFFDSAEKAAYEVRDKGLRTDNISIIAKENGNKAYYKSNNKDGNMKLADSEIIPYTVSKRERITDGIITGGIIGGILGIIIGSISMFMQKLVFFAAVGPVSGLLFGFALGGIIGGFTDVKIPEQKKKIYEDLISNGNALFSMKVDEDRMESIIKIIKDNGALLVEKY